MQNRFTNRTGCSKPWGWWLHVCIKFSVYTAFIWCPGCLEMADNRGSSSETFLHLYTLLCFVLWKGINHTMFSPLSSPESCWEQEHVFRMTTGWWATGSKTTAVPGWGESCRFPVCTLSCFALLYFASSACFPLFSTSAASTHMLLSSGFPALESYLSFHNSFLVTLHFLQFLPDYFFLNYMTNHRISLFLPSSFLSLVLDHLLPLLTH